MPTEHGNMDFIYKITPIPASKMRVWMHVPEFEAEMKAIIRAGRRISGNDILDAMERIYEQYRVELKETGRSRPGIYYSGMRNARNSLRRALYGDNNITNEDPESEEIPNGGLTNE